LFNLKTSKLFGLNLMVIQNILANIPVFFTVYFIMMYVFSEFMWIGSNKLNSEWVTEEGFIFFKSGFNSFRRMMTLSLYGNNDWLQISYENDITKFYYLCVWITFALINNVIMYNLLVSVLTVCFQQFIQKEEATLKFTQTETIHDMLVIEKIILRIHKMFNRNSSFSLRKQYFHLALYSPSYVIT
jgi:hypothetical protein